MLRGDEAGRGTRRPPVEGAFVDGGRAPREGIQAVEDRLRGGAPEDPKREDHAPHASRGGARQRSRRSLQPGKPLGPRSGSEAALAA